MTLADLEIRARLDRRQWWRVFHREILALLWAAGSAVGAVVVLVVIDALAARIAMILGIAWCGYVGWTWGRGLRRKKRVLDSGIPTLRLSDLGIQVRNLFGNLDGAALAWVDCAAVVVSRAPGGTHPVPVHRYVQFLPVAEDRVEGQPRSGDSRIALLGLTASQARTVWLDLLGQVDTADHVVAWLRTHRPGLRLVGAGDAPADQSSDE
jgi:hypothetical protein